ncbi:MAG: CDP-archaeol synthase [Lachnospiraceae bacterium]|nr:CDP-archaeol synthase [Lachnospiraceae bacterium]
MFNIIVKMYITLFPTILAGIANMGWCKSSLMKAAMKPMDFGKEFSDGKRIFGDNKTWKGFFGYILFNTIFSILWGIICNVTKIEQWNYFYLSHDNTVLLNVIIGILLGLGYALFELPNSFIKRRLDITPGKSIDGIKKAFFIFLDQADSIIGCALVVWLFYDIGIGLYLLFIIVGAFTHILINMLLYFLHLRKNMF